MKKLTILFTSICILTITNSSFGMLAKTALPRTITAHKNIRLCHTRIQPITILACVTACTALTSVLHTLNFWIIQDAQRNKAKQDIAALESQVKIIKEKK